MQSYSEVKKYLIERQGEEVFYKLQSSNVAIAGLGGIGSHIAVDLARVGVGNLHLVDFDIVETSNLNRQVYFMKDIGQKKTESLTRYLKTINPYISITTDNIIVDSGNIKEIFGNDKYICEAFDSAEMKAMFATEIRSIGKSCLISSSGMAGYGNSNIIRTRKISEDWYICGDEKTGLCDKLPLIAPRVSLCAAHMSNLVVELLLNKNKGDNNGKCK